MKLQIASRLAIFALLEVVAHPERQLTVGTIAAKYGVSTHHLAKIMHVLVRAGHVRSLRGVGGGYQFCGNARRTTLLDVIELFEKLGPRESAGVEPGEGTAEGQALNLVIGEIDDAMRATFGSITFATLAALVRRRSHGQY